MSYEATHGVPAIRVRMHGSATSADTSHGTAPAHKHSNHNRDALLLCTTEKSLNLACHWAILPVMQPRPGQLVVHEHLEHHRHAFAGRRRHRDGHWRAEVQSAQRRIHAALNAQPHRKGLLHRHALHAHAHRRLTPLPPDVCVQRTLKCLLHCRQEGILGVISEISMLGAAGHRVGSCLIPSPCSRELHKHSHNRVPPCPLHRASFPETQLRTLPQARQRDRCLHLTTGGRCRNETKSIYRETCVICVKVIPLTCGRPPQARRRR